MNVAPNTTRSHRRRKGAVNVALGRIKSATGKNRVGDRIVGRVEIQKTKTESAYVTITRVDGAKRVYRVSCHKSPTRGEWIDVIVRRELTSADLEYLIGEQMRELRAWIKEGRDTVRAILSKTKDKHVYRLEA